ncbi:hypothetical protein AAHC03_010092 [Spirometra sp. Aus1]
MDQWRTCSGILLSRNIWRLFADKQIRRLAKLPIQQGEKPKVTTKAEEVFSSLRDGSHVAIQGVASTPDPLIRDFCEYVHARNLKNVHIYTTLPFGEGLFVKEPYASHFKTTFFFLGSVGRKEVNSGKVDYAPMFLNEVPRFYRRKLIDLDMCIINVSAPDAHGNYSMGPSIKTVLGAVETAKCLVGQVNPLTPFTYGDSLLHESRFKYLVPKSMPMHTLPLPKAGTEEASIGKLIAENLIDDGSTLQMGIGSIPDIVLSLLHSHKNLGIHTEMFSDGIIDLCETGVITNALKKLYRGFIVSSFILGSERVFSFVDKNSDLIMKDVQWTNAPEIIAQNPKVVAINSCIEVSLAGHVASDSIGPRIYSGFGGQLDFLRGAAMCTDGKGKPILAMTSTTTKGSSKIVPELAECAGIVTPSDHAHYVVTEYGIAQLFGRNRRQRAYALIQVAHPKFREQLEKAAFEQLHCMPSAD